MTSQEQIAELEHQIADLLVENGRYHRYLKQALGRIRREDRVIRRCIDIDPAGNTYEEDLIPWIREALELVGENPESYL